VWAVTSADAPPAVHNKISEAAAASALSIANAAFRGAATLGFLYLPWALTIRLRPLGERRVFATAFGVLSVCACLLFLRERVTMFYLSNILGDFTVGALTTRDMHFLARPLPPTGGAAFHFLLTWASLASASALAARTWTAATCLLRLERGAAFCVLAFLLSALGTLAQAHYYFDRYLIALLPLAIASGITLAPTPRIGARMMAALAAMSIYAVAGTHDYLAWNRARWDLLATLEGQGIGARSIDGGFEYNAERLAAQLGTAPSDAEARRGQSEAKKSWWWVVDDEWVIAFGDLDGYAVADSRTFTRWLPPMTGRVLALRRSAVGPAVPPPAE
jgi:hypothetical protein